MNGNIHSVLLIFFAFLVKDWIISFVWWKETNLDSPLEWKFSFIIFSTLLAPLFSNSSPQKDLAMLIFFAGLHPDWCSPASSYTSGGVTQTLTLAPLGWSDMSRETSDGLVWTKIFYTLKTSSVPHFDKHKDFSIKS